MLIKFTKDFARNWQAGEIVEAKYLGKGEMLVGNVAKVDSSLLFKYCKIISEPDCDKTGLTNKELEYCKNDCIALNILEVPENLFIFQGGRGAGKTYYTKRMVKIMHGEKALKMAEAKLECLKNNTSGLDEICNNDCDNCELNYAQGNLGEQKEWLAMLIEVFKEYIDNINAGGI